MADDRQKRYVARQKGRGLVRVTTWVPERLAFKLRAYAQGLREAAKRVRREA